MWRGRSVGSSFCSLTWPILLDEFLPLPSRAPAGLCTVALLFVQLISRELLQGALDKANSLPLASKKDVGSP